MLINVDSVYISHHACVKDPDKNIIHSTKVKTGATRAMFGNNFIDHVAKNSSYITLP